MSDAASPDVMDRLAGLAPDSNVAALRRQRPDVVRHLQASDEAILSPPDLGGLTPSERVAAALRIAELLRDEVLASHYRQRFGSLAGGRGPADPGQAATAGTIADRWAVILAHVERVTLYPDSARRAHIDDLIAAGLTPQAIVALSQLIAYVNFQSRVLAGLKMLQGVQ
jgi:CMD domain protein